MTLNEFEKWLIQKKEKINKHSTGDLKSGDIFYRQLTAKTTKMQIRLINEILKKYREVEE